MRVTLLGEGIKMKVLSFGSDIKGARGEVEVREEEGTVAWR